MTNREFEELKDIVKKHTTDDFVVMAIPRKIRNSGKEVEVIEFAVVHRATRKDKRFMYRDTMSNLRKTVKKAVDELINEIHAELAAGPQKTTNSL
jgi:hypothetical protein